MLLHIYRDHREKSYYYYIRDWELRMATSTFSFMQLLSTATGDYCACIILV